MNRQHEQITVARPSQRVAHGLVFVVAFDDVGFAQSMPRKFIAQQCGDFTFAATAQHATDLLQQDEVRAKFRRDRGQLVQLRVLAVAGLPQQQAESTRT